MIQSQSASTNASLGMRIEGPAPPSPLQNKSKVIKTTAVVKGAPHTKTGLRKAAKKVLPARDLRSSVGGALV